MWIARASNYLGGEGVATHSCAKNAHEWGTRHYTDCETALYLSHAAVDGDFAACHEAGIIGREKEYRRCDFFG